MKPCFPQKHTFGYTDLLANSIGDIVQHHGVQAMRLAGSSGLGRMGKQDECRQNEPT